MVSLLVVVPKLDTAEQCSHVVIRVRRLIQEGVEVFVERSVHRNEMAEYRPFDPANIGEIKHHSTLPLQRSSSPVSTACLRWMWTSSNLMAPSDGPATE